MTRKPKPTPAARKGKAARELEVFALRRDVSELRAHASGVNRSLVELRGLAEVSERRIDAISGMVSAQPNHERLRVRTGGPNIDSGPYTTSDIDSVVHSHATLLANVAALERHLDAHRERLAALEARPLARVRAWWNERERLRASQRRRDDLTEHFAKQLTAEDYDRAGKAFDARQRAAAAKDKKL